MGAREGWTHARRGGIGEGQSEDRGRMEVWGSRALGGAGGWSKSQDLSPREAIYSSPSWAIPIDPDHHRCCFSISPLHTVSSYPNRGRGSKPLNDVSLFLDRWF